MEAVSTELVFTTCLSNKILKSLTLFLSLLGVGITNVFHHTQTLTIYLETGLLHVALAVLVVTLQTKLALNLRDPASYGLKGMCPHAHFRLLTLYVSV